MSINKLIYGKQEVDCIVNISVKNDTAYIFQEMEGTVSCVEMPYKHWVLSPRWEPKFEKLDGNQWFRFIRLLDSDEFQDYKKQIYQKQLYTIRHKAENFMTYEGYTYFRNMTPGEVSVLSCDIETSGLDPKAKNARVFLITNTFRRDGKITQKAFIVDDYNNDVEMIEDWCNWVRQMDPSILCLHNGMSFDLPYLNQRMVDHDKQLLLGRDGSAIDIETHSREIRVDGSQSYSYNRSNIFGREIVDTYFLAIKYDIFKKYQSYGLKAIIKQEGLEKEGRTFIDAAKIAKEWNTPNKALIIQYGIEDSDDALKLFDLMIPSFFYLANYVPKTLQGMTESATGSQINSVLVRAYLQDGYSIPKSSEHQAYEGAISFGIPGIYRKCWKVDVVGMYPSIILANKLYDKHKDTKGYFLQLIQFFFTERVKNKKLFSQTQKKKYDDLQQMQKILVNSGYGFLGGTGLNFNSPAIAAFITSEGRSIISKAIKWASNEDVTFWTDQTK